MRVMLINFDVKGDQRGRLVALEACRNVPFEVKRVYYILGTLPGVRRGLHAHKRTRQVAVSVAGSCKFALTDGTSREEVVLDSPHQGLVIEPMVWHEMFDFSSDCVVVVLASDYYDEGDYIRDYRQFLDSVAAK
jgi:dTDP-4-dehydrorhamnose 3,5-epimerase-like enzyme